MKHSREYKYKVSRALYRVLNHTVLILLSISAIIPLYFLISTSFKSREDFFFNKFGVPEDFYFSNYLEAFRGGDNFFRWLLNSTLVTLIAGLLALLCIVLASYAFVYFRFKGRNFLFNLTVSLMVFPPVVIIIPLFVFMQKLNLTNNIISVIIIYVGLMLPVGIYLISSFFSTIPREILESAFIDGCDVFKVLLKILLPISKPAIVTVVVVNALFTWNELLIALVFLNSNESRTLMAGLMSFKARYNTNLPITMAGLTIISIPIIALYFFGSKYFIKGLTSGSLKG
ncbi:MAG: carbohydrate ABC transporter permease [Actinobacteria bacterium]|nr:carbohydrate ABC transporter permease [Actinomycetota bacterium]